MHYVMTPVSCDSDRSIYAQVNTINIIYANTRKINNDYEEYTLNYILDRACGCRHFENNVTWAQPLIVIILPIDNHQVILLYLDSTRNLWVISDDDDLTFSYLICVESDSSPFHNRELRHNRNTLQH